MSATTIATTTTAAPVNHFQISHKSSHSTTTPTAAAKLPIKRVYNPHKHKFVQRIRLPYDDSISSTSPPQKNRVLVKVKICGINYLTDFNTTNSNTVIPGKRIIGKVPGFPNVKFLVYPYTTTTTTTTTNSGTPVELVHGESIDGGMQDSLVVHSSQLIPIPLNVSLHDACFINDIATVLYKYVHRMRPGRTIVLLNDVRRELNDVLVVLKHAGMAPNKVAIVDAGSVSRKYVGMFDVVYCFCRALAREAREYCAMEGDEGRENGVVLTSFETGWSEVMKLNSDDKQLTRDVLMILSKLNKEREEKDNSVGKQDTDSLVHSTASTNSSTKQYHYSWIWYDKDIDLQNYHNLHEYEDDDEDLDLPESENYYMNHMVYQMNEFLKENTLQRICYFNRKPKKPLNACII
ncbi:hypothetical protein Cantr_08203 [Candida viswanathii]|uniref:Uncharacterized protein n=1 Tax=Candida viswanathii TaxID=5486 RepID=A0A367Y3K3_9ASCO|nr:hypothetical protein Cantr_08203 [Candida viswanathii]